MNTNPETFQGESHARIELIMGMPIGIDLRDGDVDPEVIDAAFDWLRFVDATFSTYTPNSDISRLNRGELALVDANPEVRAVLERCAQLIEETNGFFDIQAARSGLMLQDGNAAAVGDPSGYVKGWSVDRAAQMLDAVGARNYAINAGGDIRVRGRPSLEEPYWRVGIRHPLVHDQVTAVVPATDLAIATSGTYERGQHILDPYTGRPSEGILSVTIVGPDLGTADAYATAAFAMGDLASFWAARLQGYEAMIVRSDETVLFTQGFPRV